MDIITNTFLQAQIRPLEEASKISDLGKLTFVLPTTDLNGFNLPNSLRKGIEQSLSTKTITCWALWEDQENWLITLPDQTEEALRLAGAEAFAQWDKMSVEAVFLGENGALSKEAISHFLEGLLLSSYRFDKYLKEKNKGPLTVYVSDVIPEEKIAQLTNLVKAVSLTKTLVNEPLSSLNAVQFSEVARKAGKHFGFDVEVLDKAQIKELKMGGLLGVNRGSIIPPTFNIFSSRPKNAVNKKPLVLVGKGVMFDTGGYSLKISGHMSNMKSDMAGGAAVLGIMAAIASNQLPHHVIGLVPATENMISPEAMVVDDILTTMDGTSVEVGNTDAEGRLILCDALSYAKQYDPELVIDMATLTGASAAITGSFGLTVLGNAEKEIDILKKSGKTVYERLVQLPLWKEYGELLKSEIADLKNIGGPIGGVSTAAKFLEHFTDYPWIHLDIAGIASIKEKNGYRQKGATGAPVRLLYEFISHKSLLQNT